MRHPISYPPLRTPEECRAAPSQHTPGAALYRAQRNSMSRHEEPSAAEERELEEWYDRKEGD